MTLTNHTPRAAAGGGDDQRRALVCVWRRAYMSGGTRETHAAYLLVREVPFDDVLVQGISAVSRQSGVALDSATRRVQRIADQWMAGVGHVNPDLM